MEALPLYSIYKRFNTYATILDPDWCQLKKHKANNADPDLTDQDVPADFDLHCLPTPYKAFIWKKGLTDRLQVLEGK
jgi:hypothetical protein